MVVRLLHINKNGLQHVVKPIGADDADTNVFTILVCFYRGTR
jgi:hypothetical protein